MIYVVECCDLLVELEEVDFVCPHFFHLTLVLLSLRTVQHSNTCLREIVCHGKLGVAVEADVILVLTNLLVVDPINIALRSSVVTLCPTASIPLSMRICRVSSVTTSVIGP